MILFSEALLLLREVRQMASKCSLLYFLSNRLNQCYNVKLISVYNSVFIGSNRNEHFSTNLAFVLNYRCVSANVSVKFPQTIKVPYKPTENRTDELQSGEINYPQYPKFQLKRFIYVLKDNGFPADSGVEMITKCEEILRKNETDLNQIITSFRKCKFQEEDIIHILKSCPQHFCADPNNIVSRYMSLRQQFSHKLIKQIFSSCPNIMSMKWSVIQKKIEYLKNFMFVVDRQIAFSTALEFPLDYIKLRHTFLERAGLFETPKPKSTLLTKNPSLSKIIETEDEYFAEKVAGLSAEEYRVFEEIFFVEKDNFQEEEDDELEDSE